MNRIAHILVIVFLASSCSKSANPDKVMSDYGNAFLFDETYYINIEIPYEDAWFNVLFALEDFDWPIEYESQTSGTITTEMTNIGTNKDRYACRDFMDSRTRVDAMTCQLRVQVTRVDEHVTRIRILADIRGRYVYATSMGDEHVGGWWKCTSTGEIEGEIFDSFLSRVEPVRYVAPVYRR